MLCPMNAQAHTEETEMQTIIVRTAADPGDTSYVDESVDWPREERRYINRLAEALDGAYPCSAWKATM